MKEAPKGGKIVSEKKDDIFGTTMLTLSNGVKVIIKKTDFKADEIRMKGVSMVVAHSSPTRKSSISTDWMQ